MSSSDEDGRIAATTRVLQIIVGALTVGLLTFLVIAASIGQQPRGGQAFITGVGIVMAIGILSVRLILPRLIVAGERRRLSRDAAEIPLTSAEVQGRLCELYQRKTIMGAALIEGVAFFMLIAYFMERTPLALVLSVLLILGVAMQFPTRARIEHWLDTQRELIESERQLAP